MARRSFFSSGNPFMSEDSFRNNAHDTLDGHMIGTSERMTEAGAVNKSFILFGLMLLTALISYTMPNMLFLGIGAIGGLIVVLIASFKAHLSPTLAPIYALLEGLFVGTITAVYGAKFGGGIIFHAVTLTFAVLFMMLFLYKTGVVKVTEQLRSGITMAVGAIALVYLVNIVMRLFGTSLPFLHEGGTIGIGISVVIVGVAAFSLLLDFDNFKKGEQYGAPKYMEWYSAMGLLVTLVWLYIEILRLVSKFSSRD